MSEAVSRHRAEVAPPRFVERMPVEGQCPACGGALARYPVLSEGGWFMTTKCQVCLHPVARERWETLGYVQILQLGRS